MTALQMERIDLKPFSLSEKIRDCFSLYWMNLKNLVNPKQQYLYKMIPNHEAEKNQLMEDLIYAIFIDYVENDKVSFGQLSDEIKSEMLDCYRWAKIESEEEQRVVENAFDEYHYRLVNDENRKMAELTDKRNSCINLREAYMKKSNSYLCRIIDLRCHMVW